MNPLKTLAAPGFLATLFVFAGSCTSLETTVTFDAATQTMVADNDASLTGDGSNAEITVTLANPSRLTVRVSYELTGTAVGATDFLAGPGPLLTRTILGVPVITPNVSEDPAQITAESMKTGTIEIPPGTTTATLVAFKNVNDTTTDATVIVTITGVENANLGDISANTVTLTASGTGTPTPPAIPPTPDTVVAFDTAPSVLLPAPYTITFTLNPVSAVDIDIPFTVTASGLTLDTDFSVDLTAGGSVSGSSVNHVLATAFSNTATVVINGGGGPFTGGTSITLTLGTLPSGSVAGTPNSQTLNF